MESKKFRFFLIKHCKTPLVSEVIIYILALNLAFPNPILSLRRSDTISPVTTGLKAKGYAGPGRERPHKLISQCRESFQGISDLMNTSVRQPVGSGCSSI